VSHTCHAILHVLCTPLTFHPFLLLLYVIYQHTITNNCITHDAYTQDIESSGASRDAIKQDLLELAGETADADSRIGLENFIKVCDIIVEQIEMRRRAVQKFQLLDADKSGYLENTELHKGEKQL
jgi:hypothetical protein